MFILFVGLAIVLVGITVAAVVEQKKANVELEEIELYNQLIECEEREFDILCNMVVICAKMSLLK